MARSRPPINLPVKVSERRSSEFHIYYPSPLKRGIRPKNVRNTASTYCSIARREEANLLEANSPRPSVFTRSRELCLPNCALSGLHTFCSKAGELGRRVRSWPFDTLIGAFCPTFRALSDAPISVANGHDLTLIPSSPILEQKVCSPESAQVGKHNTQCRSCAVPTRYLSSLSLLTFSPPPLLYMIAVTCPPARAPNWLWG